MPGDEPAVTGNHLDRYAEGGEAGNGVTDAGFRPIEKRDEPLEVHVVFVFAGIRGTRAERSRCHGDDANAVRTPAVVALLERRSCLLVQGLAADGRARVEDV